MAVPKLIFLVQEPGLETRLATTTAGIVKIGRHAKSHIALTDPSVSRMHAVIEVTDTGAVVIDLGGEPTTEVNGRRVSKQQLELGDRLKIGNTVLRLERIGDAAAPPLLIAAVAPVVTPATAAALAPTGLAPQPSPAQARAASPWNWDDAPKPSRKEHNVAGPALAVALFLLVLIAFLVLR